MRRRLIAAQGFLSIFTDQTPSQPDLNNAAPIILATTFETAETLDCYGCEWFFPATLPGGPVQAALWQVTDNANGVLLTSEFFTDPTAGAKCRVLWPAPEPLAVGQLYRIGVYTPDRYVGSNNVFAAAGITNGPLTAIQDNAAPHVGIRNGVFRDPAPVLDYPSATFLASNYHVDVLCRQ